MYSAGIMRIAVLGATGRTGLQVVEQALERGWEVVALVRSPDKFPQQIVMNPDFSAHKIDVFDAETFASYLEDVSAIISCLGVKRFGDFWSTTFYSDSMLAIVKAMKIAKVTRLLALSAWFTEHNPSHPILFEFFVRPIVLGAMLRDLRRMEVYLAHDSDCMNLEYTVVRPPQLVDGALSDKALLTAVGQQWVQDAKVYKVSRADMAKFLLEHVSTVELHRQIVAVGSGDHVCTC